MKTIAIIPSGGSGKRVKSLIPKQYITFEKKELIVYTLEIIQNCNLIDEIIISAQIDYHNLIKHLKEKYNLNKISNIVEGGDKRQESVYNALRSIKANQEDLILIHDAVRPLLPDPVLKEAILSAMKYNNVIVAIQAKDTIIEGEDVVSNYLNRENVYMVQTPQVFKYNILLHAMNKAKSENFFGTDESMLVKRTSNKISIVKGSPINIKITTEQDIDFFANYIKGRSSN
ncbi:2-C-methyl-D-erythritol 4-phosphate cytidylyltransferase [Bacteroidota bacterium]